MSRPSCFYLSQTGNELRPIDFVGEEHLEGFVAFCKTLLGIVPTTLADSEYIARLAPSVVTRGELQLFNLDIPRFCVRIYLGENRGFVNLRRMREVARRITREEWLTAPDQITVFLEDGKNSEYRLPENLPLLSEVFGSFDSKHNVVADCLLAPPDRLRKHDHDHEFVTAALGWAYGEGSPFRSVPYVRSIRGFSGGACAQACAFMVSALLQEHCTPDNSEPVTSGVHGLAEITALTTPESFAFLRLSGLRPSVLVQYFVKSGRTVFQYSFGKGRGKAQPDENVGASARAFLAISSHVRSAFSPILSVSSPEVIGGPRPDKLNHAVVVVGASKTSRHEPAPKALIINDPSNKPFDSWDQVQFRDSCITHSHAATIYCVMPREIKCPLTLGTITDRAMGSDKIKTTACYGVFELATVLHAARISQDATAPLQAPVLSDFTLVRLLLETHPNVPSIPACLKHLLPLDDTFASKWKSSEHVRALAGKWCWVQICMKTGSIPLKINLWDAEAAPIPRDKGEDLFGPDGEMAIQLCESFILASLELINGHWEASSNSPKCSAITTAFPRTAYAQPDRNPGPPIQEMSSGGPSKADLLKLRRARQRLLRQKDRSNRALGISVLTSCSATTLTLALSQHSWPAVAATADLYAFMHCDDYLFGGPVNYSPGTRPSVAELLAKFYRLPPHLQDKRISDLANRLAAVAKNVPVAINAMATHMPQLYSVNKNRANEAFDAFCFLARLREKLPKGHDIRTIEISAGSLVKGILPRRTEANEPAIKLLAWRRSRPDAYRLLIKRITRLCHRIDASCRDTNFSLALELEPGPLFVLHDMDSLVDVAQRIENSTSAALKRRVGFNIDIAHCILAGIDPDALFANNSIADRICHFHISDHGIGHFGDAPLGDCGFGRWSLTPDDRLALLRPWIRHAVQYAQKRPTDGSGDAPRFSGLISLELEAAQSPEMVERSASILDQLLTEAGNDDGLRSNKNTLAKLISWIPLPRRAHR